MAGIGRQRELQTAISVYQKELVKYKRIIEEYPIKLEERLNEVGRQVVARWYADYEPTTYRRTRSLYQAFRVEREGFNVNVEFDSELIEASHRVSNDYIFENSFIEGYHGGADSGPKHPDLGTPYWRTPPPRYPRWYKKTPAYHSFSPYDEMVSRMQEEIDDANRELKEDLNEVVRRLTRTIMSYLRN